jgi:hypothetical protein
VAGGLVGLDQCGKDLETVAVHAARLRLILEIKTPIRLPDARNAAFG